MLNLLCVLLIVASILRLVLWQEVKAIYRRWWICVSDRELRRTEQDLLEHCDLKPQQDYTIQKVQIEMPSNRSDMLSTSGASATQLFMHTITIKQLTLQEYNKVKKPSDGPYKPRRLLFIPGWAAPGAAYAFMFKELQKYFEITTIDMLGFACSGRPDYHAATIDTTNEFFMLSLESWMKQTGYDQKKDRFNIMAHSMGCYFATLYSVRNPTQVDQLLFISAAGIYGNPDDWSPEKFIASGTSKEKRFVYWLGTKFWNTHVSPTYFFKLGGYWMARKMQQGWSLRLKSSDKIGIQRFLDLLYQSSMRHASSDSCISVLMHFEGGRQPLIPVFRANKDMDWKVTMVYGEKDFFKTHGGDLLLQEGTIKHGAVYLAKNCGHHPYFDDPQKTNQLLLNKFFEIENSVGVKSK